MRPTLIPCHACETPFKQVVGVSTCPDCSASQLVLCTGHIHGYCEGEVCRIRGRYLVDQAQRPVLVEQPGTDQNYAWGAPWVFVDGLDPSLWLLLYPLSRLASTELLYHGTAPESLPLIQQRGLLPAAVTGYSKHGSEREFSFVGLDRASVVQYDQGSIIELTYGGWIAHTVLRVGSSGYKDFFNACSQVDADVHAIRYQEDGASVVFASTAKDIILADTQHNYLELQKASGCT